nr:hypothetical protein [Tanacetum cinerariifolium]
MAPKRTTRNSNRSGGRGNGYNGNEGENPDIATTIPQQLQDLLPIIITQVGNHIKSQRNRNDRPNDDSNNERNAEGGNERNNPRNVTTIAMETDAHIRNLWRAIRLSSVAKEIQARGREDVEGMAWDDFKA